MKLTPDQIVGVLSSLVAAGMAFVSSDYTVAFYTDPLGARGLPYLAAILLAIGGVTLTVRRNGESRPAQGTSRVLWQRGTAATAGLLAYAMVLPVAGFVTTTAGFVFLLGRIFGGPTRQNAVLAIVYTIVLYMVFAIVLGLSLPIGSLFLRSA